MAKSRLEELEKSEAYSAYQEELAFQKELNILRNDFYYQMVDSKTTALVDFLYRPLDNLSGDAYSARRIDQHRTFYLIVDGMGKGISASLTTITMTSFINHLIDKMIAHDSFSLEILIQESMAFIQPILLDDEVLAIDYICFDSNYSVLEYAKFAMPPFLLHDKENNIIKIRSNNPPLSKWGKSYEVSRHNIANIEKFLFYSDGIVENAIKDDTKSYASFIEDDFRDSFTREEFKEKFYSRIAEPEDDLTLIFINSLAMEEKNVVEKALFETSMDTMESASEWYEALWKMLEVEENIADKASLVFTELFTNAYEHGNLGIDSKLKHKYIQEDIYFEKLAELEAMCTKKIAVEVYKIKHLSDFYIITKICDEGEGFDTQQLSQIFRNSKKFNGRGVFVSRKNSMGIYYNSQGNCVLFLNKI
jgi:hypothetical protein